MPPLDTWLLFCIACVALVATPGPNILYLVSRTLAQGRAAGFIVWISGSYSNVVGLPLYETHALLTGLGYLIGPA